MLNRPMALYLSEGLFSLLQNAIKEKGINLGEVEKDVMGTEKEKKPPFDEKK